MRPRALGCLEVDDQLELHGLLHRQVGRLGALQDFVHVGGDALPTPARLGHSS